MKLAELLKELKLNTEVPDIEISDICFDSRKVKRGSLFVSLYGTKIDGHLFIEDVVKNGAAAVIAERNDKNLENIIVVPDSHAALSLIAATYYDFPSKKLKLIGVTGTNGKTSITYMIKNLLESNGSKCGLIGTIHNMIGDSAIETGYTTPEPLELQYLFNKMVNEGCEYVIMEVSSHSLAQQRVYGLHFVAGVFSNLTQDHLDLHGTMENYFKEKAKLFTMCDVAVLNADDRATEELLKISTAKNFTYSAYLDNADVVAKNISLKPNRVEFETITGDKIGRAVIKIPAMFTVYNSLAAITTALVLGMDFDSVINAVKDIKGIKGRVEVFETGRDFTIILDYAHTPDGLSNVLKTVKSIATGRIVCLFGCGGDRDRAKRPLMGKIASEYSDYMVITSDNPRTENPAQIIDDILEGIKDINTPYIVIENRKEAIEYAVKNAIKDDILLLAGKGHETYQILSTGKIHFDEREVLSEILREMN